MKKLFPTRTFAYMALFVIAMCNCTKDPIPVPLYEDGLEAVDLGLSVKWAPCNVGAKKPSDYGYYFAWGEISPKSDYSWSTYKWGNGRIKTLSKYNNSDNMTILDMSDDVARANWGSGWRMPTRSEFQELIDNCTWTWTLLDGKNGYKVTGQNGNSIFLPAGGYNGTSGSYWSSSLMTNYHNNAWYLYIYPSGRIMYSECLERCYGLSIRPITEQ